MLQKLLLAFGLCFCCVAFGQFKVSGQILNQKNEVVEGCHIHIGNKSAISNSKGNYTIKNVPVGKILMFFSGLGYDSVEKNLVLTQDLVFDIKLTIKITALKEVSLNQKRNSENNSILEQKIKLETIEKYSSQTLGDVLREVAGVSVLKTGSNIVKPIINGLHSSRVPIISNNVRLEDQQWGSEHAPNFDVNAAGKITIIKGASALQYGGDAIGGIVIIESVDVKKDTLFGKTISNFSSNGRGGSLSSSLHKGNFCDWSWNVLGTFKYFGDRNAPNYVLSNSGNREYNFSGDFKFTGKKYDVAVLYSLYNSQIGILSAAHIGNVNDLLLSISNQIPNVVNNFTYSIKNPKQEFKHHLAKVNFNYYFDDNSTLGLQYSFQLNSRQEFDLRRSTFKNIPALDLQLITNTLKSDFEKEFENWQIKSGLNIEIQNNIANPLTGVRPLIPNYERKDFGIYAIGTNEISSSLTLDFGLRYDFSNIQAEKFYFKTRWNERGYNNFFNNFIVGETAIGDQWLAKPKFIFHNFSASLGIHKQFNQNENWFVNLSLASRNPNPSEFFSDGLHHSTGQIELGDLALKKEQSFKIATTFQKKWSSFLVEINPFCNSIQNFMFLKPVGFETTTRGAFPVWNYEQTNALLTGFDFNMVWNVAKNWKHQFSFASVNGLDLTNNLPLIAMPQIRFSNKIQFSKPEFYGLTIELKNEVVLQQIQFPNNDFTTQIVQDNALVDVNVPISQPPKGYQLWDFYSQMNFKTFNKSSMTVAFSVQNITNTNYRDYLNNQRFFVDELGRNFQLQLKFNY